MRPTDNLALERHFRTRQVSPAAHTCRRPFTRQREPIDQHGRGGPGSVRRLRGSRRIGRGVCKRIERRIPIHTGCKPRSRVPLRSGVRYALFRLHRLTLLLGEPPDFEDGPVESFRAGTGFEVAHDRFEVQGSVGFEVGHEADAVGLAGGACWNGGGGGRNGIGAWGMCCGGEVREWGRL